MNILIDCFSVQLVFPVKLPSVDHRRKKPPPLPEFMYKEAKDVRKDEKDYKPVPELVKFLKRPGKFAFLPFSRHRPAGKNTSREHPEFLPGKNQPCNGLRYKDEKEGAVEKRGKRVMAEGNRTNA